MSGAEYEHTQVGRIHWLFVVLGGGFAAAGLFGDSPASGALLASGVILFAIAASFRQLTVRDEGDSLALRFGPLPVFRKRIRYAEVTAVRAERSTLIDGWGIHWVPGRGWIFNLWGWDCVRLERERGALRVGTDDPEELTAFLQGRIGA